MKNLFLTLLLILSNAAFAQDENADPDADCAAVLAAPPFVDMLTRNEGRDFGELSPLKSGRALLGLECSVDKLTVFFEDAGWELLRYEEQRLVGPFGVPGAEYYSDASAHYCLKRPTLFGMFDFRCRPRAGISFVDGRISNIGAYTSK